MVAACLSLIVAACGNDAEVSPLANLELSGVDFQLNSLLISNNGDDEIRTQGLWAYRDGEFFEFNIFIIAPRATIRFSMRDLGDVSTSGGELALADSDTFTDPSSLLAYVVWGDGDFELSDVAAEAGLWPPDEGTAEVDADAVVLLRADPTGTGPAAWLSSTEVP